MTLGKGSRGSACRATARPGTRASAGAECAALRRRRHVDGVEDVHEEEALGVRVEGEVRVVGREALEEAGKVVRSGDVDVVDVEALVDAGEVERSGEGFASATMRHSAAEGSMRHSHTCQRRDEDEGGGR